MARISAVGFIYGLGVDVGWQVLTQAMARGARVNAWMLVLVCALTLAGTLGGCSLFGGSSSAGNSRALNQLTWCDRKDIKFTDESAAGSAPITNFDDVKNLLGFTYYLPPTLPKGTCVDLAGGSIHDPIYGGKFSITFDLPDSGPLSFAETPKLPNMSKNVQCLQSPQDTKTNICLGVVNDTSVTIASRLAPADIQNIFASLKAGVDWPPQVEPAAPTATSAH